MKIAFACTRKPLFFSCAGGDLSGSLLIGTIEINTDIARINNNKEHLSHRYIIVPLFFPTRQINTLMWTALTPIAPVTGTLFCRRLAVIPNVNQIYTCSL